MEKYVITIGRQLGSGGKLTGELLSRKLGIPCYDKELIQMASMKSGLGREFFEKADEKNSVSILGNYISFRSGFMGHTAINYLSNETLFKIQSDVIRNLAEKESCIFVGRCADYILRNYRHCLKIFICADRSDRIQRICRDCRISEKEAGMRIEQTDKKRASYYNYFSNKTWGAAISYDMCFNSSVLGIENIAGIVEDFVKKQYLLIAEGN
ncbi:MAG: cytidylate kinase-like family protein, partial [Dysgonamonadaceae bacterium]|nr:cytidylate kinase-like family protein [Dysgonamonadaceae bacterium]